jgi:hypothetical protein
MDLHGAAEAQALTATAAVLAPVGESPLFFPPAPPDAALTAPTPNDPVLLLTLMARRGFQPALVETALTWLESRPLERSLFSWDVLCGSVLPFDQPELQDRLRYYASQLTSIPPAGKRGIELAAHPASELMRPFLEQARSRPESELAQGLISHDLVAVAAMAARDSVFAHMLRMSPAKESLRAFAERLLLARAYTWAGVFCDYLVRDLGDADALPLLCDSFLDGEVPERLPTALLGQDDLGEYATYRAAVETGKLYGAWALLKTAATARELSGQKPGPMVAVVATEIACRFKGTPDRSALEGVRPNWPYASRVGIIESAKRSAPDDEEPLARIVEHVQRYGNDLRIWHHAWKLAQPGSAWRQASCRYLSREAFHLPHEPSVWRALGCAVADDAGLAGVMREIDERIVLQSQL